MEPFFIWCFENDIQSSVENMDGVLIWEQFGGRGRMRNIEWVEVGGSGKRTLGWATMKDSDR
jgi:hypothetical protein